MHSKVVKKNDPTDQSDNEFRGYIQLGKQFNHQLSGLHAQFDVRVRSVCSPRDFLKHGTDFHRSAQASLH